MAIFPRFRMRELQIVPFLFGGCGVKAITCLGDPRIIFVMEEDTPGQVPPWPRLIPLPQRIFVSMDNAATPFTPIEPIDKSANSLWVDGRAFPLRRNEALVGPTGPQMVWEENHFYADDYAALTTDGGVTFGPWGNNLPGEYGQRGPVGSLPYQFAPVGGSDSWTTMDFLPLDGGEIWALGAFSYGGGLYGANVLRSLTDDPPVFEHPLAVLEGTTGFTRVVTCGAYLGDNIVLLGMAQSPSAPRVWRSTDRGATWTELLLPLVVPQYAGSTMAMLDMVYMGDGVVIIAGACPAAVGQHPPRVWRSTDYGVSWADYSSSIPGITPPYTQTITGNLLKLNDTAVLMAIDGKPDNMAEGEIKSNWRLSLDKGANWLPQRCIAWHDGIDNEYPFPTSTYLSFHDWTISNDGARVVMTVNISGAAGLSQRIWIGEPGDLTLVSPCQGVEFEEEEPPPEPEPEPEPCVHIEIVNDAGTSIVIGLLACTCAPQAFFPTLVADSEVRSVLVPISQSNVISALIAEAGHALGLDNDILEPLDIVTTGLVLSKHDAPHFGHYLGWTLRGTDAPFHLETVEMEYAPTRRWDAP